MLKMDLTIRSTRLVSRGVGITRGGGLVHTCPRARLFSGIKDDNDRRNLTVNACFGPIRVQVILPSMEHGTCWMLEG